jgi:hypothetical protein
VPLYYRAYEYYQLLSPFYEAFGILIIFLSELLKSNFFEELKYKKKLYTTGKDGSLREVRNESPKRKGYNIYVVIEEFLKEFLLLIEDYLVSYKSIQVAWYWIWNEPNPENCKITFSISVAIKGSTKDALRQIDDIRIYPRAKLFGYFMVFLGFSLQLTYVYLAKAYLLIH